MALTQVASGLIASVSGASLTGTQTIPKATLPTGSVLQVVTANITTSASTSSATPVATGLSATITPLFSTSKILVQVVGGTADTVGTTGQQTLLTIYRNSTNLFGSNGSSLTYNSGARSMAPACAGILDAPATTSATTYALYIASANTAGTVTLIANSSVVTMTLMEISA